MRALEEIAFSLYGELIPEPQNSLRGAGKVDAIATEVLWHSDDPETTGRTVVAFISATHGADDCSDSRWHSMTEQTRGAACIRQSRARDGGVYCCTFSGLTQGRGAVENSDGPALIIAVHVAFAFLALAYSSHWERVTKGWRVVGRA